ncbi:hypothetical protein VNO77_22695 [Canavalia gladiata]|uniref:Uncharacterized protein n=1 Tax=Canavalia gladiata TaxID=3824 RepID=A0AAN9L8B4_CANGL
MFGIMGKLGGRLGNLDFWGKTGINGKSKGRMALLLEYIWSELGLKVGPNGLHEADAFLYLLAPKNLIDMMMLSLGSVTVLMNTEKAFGKSPNQTRGNSTKIPPRRNLQELRRMPPNFSRSRRPRKPRENSKSPSLKNPFSFSR